LLAFMPTNQHIVKQNCTAPISFSGIDRILQAALPGDDMLTPFVDHLHKIEGALRIPVEDDPFYFYIFVERKRYDRNDPLTIRPDGLRITAEEMAKQKYTIQGQCFRQKW